MPMNYTAQMGAQPSAATPNGNDMTALGSRRSERMGDAASMGRRVSVGSAGPGLEHGDHHVAEQREMMSMVSSETTVPDPYQHAYEDLEGLATSVGMLFALLVPAAMVLQHIGFDEGVHNKNLLMLLCTNRQFREFVHEVGEESSSFRWSFPLGGSKFLNVKAVLQNIDKWAWDNAANKPEAVYDCGEVKEFAATARYLQAVIPRFRIDTWVLAHPESAIWTDHLSGLTSLCMCVLFAGLCGALLIYISLALSPGREDPSQQAVQRWSKFGYPTLLFNVCVLAFGIFTLLLAHETYTESQDPFFVRGGRWSAYSKVALLTAYMPVTTFFFVGAVIAYILSRCRITFNLKDEFDWTAKRVDNEAKM